MQSDIRNESEKDILSKRGYSFVKKLGEGGFSKVYLAEFKSKLNLNNLQVACKIINLNKIPKKFLKKFLPRELAILIKVNHPHIISILSIYQRRNNIYIFMRYAENGDLLDYILKNDAVPEDQARIWVKQIALGVQYLHILNIAHRDLKCENILLTKNFNCKIADFGFACHIKLLNNLPLSYEMSNTFCGTESYAPPEIIHGELYDPKIADIWTFGILIYVILNKANPFDSKNLKVLYKQQMNKNWKFRSKYQNILSNEIKELLKGMLEPNPKNRIKIEEVINSSWIAMNPKLKILNNAEYNAFEAAINEIKNINKNKIFTNDDNNNDNGVDIVQLKKKGNHNLNFKVDKKNRESFTIFREEDSSFNMQIITSDAVDVVNKTTNV